jgi:hypothetical protein
MGLFGKRLKDPVRGTAQVVSNPHPTQGSVYAGGVDRRPDIDLGDLIAEVKKIAPDATVSVESSGVTPE